MTDWHDKLLLKTLQEKREKIMENLLISTCLLGINCKYNGGNNYCCEVEKLKKYYHLIPVCAENLSGLPIPRVPAERKGSQIINKKGEDVTEQFNRGASEVLKLARFFHCRSAVLKERSPSCGFGEIYDGTFTGTTITGNGVLAELLSENGISIYGESRIRELLPED